MRPLFVVVLVMVISKQCTAVDTVVNALLKSDVVLPCDHGVEKDSVDIAQWFKPPSSTPPIAQKFHDRWNVSPKYNLTTNFSLYVDDVDVDDEARYKCLINPDGYRHDYEGFVQLRLSAYPDRSKSLIEGCGASDARCDRTLIAGDSAVVSCWASDVYPETYPEWTTVGSTIDAMTVRTSTKNKDGTFKTSVELRFDVDIMSETELECTLNNGDYNLVSAIRLRVANRTSQVLTSPKETPRPSQFTTTQGGPDATFSAQEGVPVNVIVPATVPIVIIVVAVGAVAVVLKRGKGILSRARCCSKGREKQDEEDGASGKKSVGVGYLPPSEQEHGDYSALPEEEHECSLAPHEEDHVDYSALPEGEHKGYLLPSEQEHLDYSALPEEEHEGSLAPPEEEHEDSSGLPEGEHKGFLAPIEEEHVDYSALPEGEDKGSLNPREQEHVDYSALPEGEDKGSLAPPEPEHADYSALPAKTKRAMFHSNRQKTILDDYKFKT